MISFFSLGLELSIHTLDIFIGPREVGQKIEQTYKQTNTLGPPSPSPPSPPYYQILERGSTRIGHVKKMRSLGNPSPKES